MLYKIEPPYTERYVRWCERSSSQLMTRVLLDLSIIFDALKFRLSDCQKKGIYSNEKICQIVISTCDVTVSHVN
jgi:hypothetical protein